MEHFFEVEMQDDDIFSSEIGPLNQSTFVPYTSRPRSEIAVESSSNGSNSTNMNKRIIEFMRRSWPMKDETQESDSKRCFRHMMSERMRREREKKGYLGLHSMLPHGTKNDKNSIMQTSAMRIQELKRYKEVLERRKYELEAKLAAVGSGNMGSTKIRLKVGNPTSGVDSMLEVLKCLKSLGSKTRSIQSKFSDQELVAVMDIETEIDAAEVEKAVQIALQEVERKLQSQLLEGYV